MTVDQHSYDVSQSKLIAGRLLIGLGLFLFILRLTQGYGEAVTLFTIASGFLAGYFAWRKYSLLVVGGITMGAGLGALADSWSISGIDITQAALGVGFLSIYLIDRLVRGSSPLWPLIPGLILLLLGVTAEKHVIQQCISYGWPLILVGWGGYLLLKNPTASV